MESRVEVLVVYNDRPTLESAFLTSCGLGGARVVLIDNTVAGRSLPDIFNEHKAKSAAAWLVFCHQDFVVFDHDWIDRITRLSKDSCYGPIGVDTSGRFVGRVKQTDGSLLGLELEGAEVIGLDEQCLIVPIEIYSRVDFDGRFAFDLYSHDYCLSARQAGFGVKTFQINCQHRSKSITGDVARASYVEAKGTYIAKHKALAPLITTTFQWRPKYWSTAEDVETIRFELALIPEGSRVLEVGTAAGHVTGALNRRGCEVTGLELDAELAALAEPFCRRLVVGNVEDLDLDVVIPGYFDAILCGDVLEHLKDPGAVLQKLKRRLTPTGYLVVSIPNIAHGSVRLSLLEGNFRYVEEGLLDFTHLRFFTLASLVELFNQHGFRIQDLHRTRIGLFETEITIVPTRSLLTATVRRLIRDPEATTYQYVFRAVPSEQPNRLSDLEDAKFDPRGERRAFAAHCLGRAWTEFHAAEPDATAARTWARLSFGTVPSWKAGLYWLASFLPASLREAGKRPARP